MTDAAEVPPIEHAAAGQVPTDAVCINCGYLLRGLPPGANCPECGTPVRRSLARDNVWADRTWLRQVRLGCLLLIGAEVLLLAGATPVASDQDRAVHVVLRMTLPAALVCAAVACALMSRRTPWAREPDERLIWQRRGMLALAGVAVVVAFAYVPFALSGRPAGFAPVLLLAGACVSAAFFYLSHLARVMIDPDLSASALGVGVGLGACTVIAALLVLAARVGALRNTVMLLVALGLSCVGLLALIICALIALGVLIDMIFATTDALR